MQKRQIAFWLVLLVALAELILPFAAVPLPITTSANPSPQAIETTTANTPTDTLAKDTEPPVSPPLKGVWVASVFNLDYPQKASVDANQLKKDADSILDHVQALGLNSVFLQVRPSGDALYASSRFPWSAFLTGKQGLAPGSNFDPLQYWVEAAHQRGIQLHAWMNPYRVTTTAVKAGENPYNQLAANNPARLSPELTVLHSDGRLYYNPGLPEVRNLIISEIVDLVSRYDIDGVHFDDYFYPGEKFADEAAFKLYGRGLALADWRRDNNTALVRDIYQAIKAIKPNVAFGVSPFGIWANSKQVAGGSDTAGNQSYSNQYADTKKWVELGILDYIMPQIYWQIGFDKADYAKLVDWWHKLVSPTKVKLYIGHAAYRSGDKDATSAWAGDHEIIRQLQLNAQYAGIRGSVFYRYSTLKTRSSLANAIQAFYASNPGQGSGSTVKPDFPIKLTSPSKDFSTSLANYYLAGVADPKVPLFVNGQAVTTRSSKGYFGIYLPLAKGINRFVFTQGSETFTRVIGRGVSVASSSGQGNANSSSGGSSTSTASSTSSKPRPLEAEIVLSSTYPQKDEMWLAGEQVTLTATAPIGAQVTAYIQGLAIPLKPKVTGIAKSPIVHTNFTATYKMPQLSTEKQDLGLGKIRYEMRYGNRIRRSDSPGTLTILTANSSFWAEVKEDTTDTYPYQQTAKGAAHFASKGMIDRIIGRSSAMIRLASGYWVKTESVSVRSHKTLNFDVKSIQYHVGAKEDKIDIALNRLPAAYTKRSGSSLIIDLGPVSAVPDFQLPANSLAETYKIEYKDQRARLILQIPTAKRLMGHWVTADKNQLTVILKRQVTLSAGDKPLSGVTIMLDPGHGGNDPGAVSFQGSNYAEKHINLDVSLKLRDQLKSLGASVVMTRDQDLFLSLQDRLRLSLKAKPDIFLSIHANSIGPELNIGNIHGFSAHYSDAIAQRTADAILKQVVKDLTRKSRGIKLDNFYVVRGTWAPSVLIETGFMPNPLEYDWLSDPDQQRALADALTKGILESLK